MALIDEFVERYNSEPDKNHPFHLTVRRKKYIGGAIELTLSVEYGITEVAPLAYKELFTITNKQKMSQKNGEEYASAMLINSFDAIQFKNILLEMIRNDQD
jgi:hypothetical protein